MTSNISKGEKEIWATRAKTWNKNFRKCRLKAGYKSQKEFAKAFKEKYGISNQADISRWERVGEVIERNKQVRDEQGTKTIRKPGTIGFPSYENMKRAADFFGVTVGYLTGETDFVSFDMEKACTYFEINEATGKSIQKITRPPHMYSFDFLFRKEHRSALEYMLNAESFKLFIEELCHLAVTIRRKQNPINYVENLKTEFDPEVVDLASKFMGRIQSEETLDIPETEEFENVLHRVEEADALETKEFLEIDRQLKADRYALYELYVRLVDEIVSDSHLDAMTKKYMHAFTSIEEMRHCIEEDANELPK